MVEKIRDYVLGDSWEEDLDRSDDLFESICWIVIILAALYFGWGFLQAMLEGAIK